MSYSTGLIKKVFGVLLEGRAALIRLTQWTQGSQV
jgi:hypothetical protein